MLSPLFDRLIFRGGETVGDDVDRIKSRLDVVDIVGDYVKLTRSGRNYKGLCPFHEEKTPSFYVSQERQSWHCFGCGKGGDIFSFVMEKEGLSFPETLSLLARRAGIEIESYRRSDGSGKKTLFDIMEEACSLFRKCMDGDQGSVPRGYLDRRMIPPQVRSSFELGWSPPSWSFMVQYIKEKGISLKDAERCGLVLRGDRGPYDRFRGRVIFPIRDITGRLVAFGGRIVDGDGAKYLNSPETEIYSKRRTLYLIDKAKGAIRNGGHSIIVEGYMDALRLHMEGYSQTVATLGTALTEDQATILKRLADEVFICYDADQAGQAAAIRGMYVLQKAGLSVKVVALPEGQDPDDLLRSDGGKASFDGCLEKALPLIEHHIKLLSPAIKDDRTRKSAIHDLLEGLSHIDVTDVSPYLPSLAALLGIRDFEVLDALEKVRSGRRKSGRFVDTVIPPSLSDEDRDSQEMPPLPEIALISLLWSECDLRRKCDTREVVELLSDPRLKLMAGSIMMGESPSSLEKRWLEMGETFQLRVLARGGAYLDEFTQNSDWKWRHFCHLLYRQKGQMRYNELRVKMLKGEATTREIREMEDLRQKLVSQKGS